MKTFGLTLRITFGPRVRRIGVGTGAPPTEAESRAAGRYWLLGALAMVAASCLCCFLLVRIGMSGAVARGMVLRTSDDVQSEGLFFTLYGGSNFERALRTMVYTGPLDVAIGPSLGIDLPTRDCSLRFSGRLKVKDAGNYQFLMDCEEGARLWVDGRLVVDCWPKKPQNGLKTQGIALAVGEMPFLLEARNSDGDGRIALKWLGPKFTARLLGPKDFLADPHPGYPKP